MARKTQGNRPIVYPEKSGRVKKIDGAKIKRKIAKT
jgi:hypothetical protein